LKKLAIITTHPIQYYAPLFHLIAERNKIEIKVFYTWGVEAKEKVFDPGFGKERQWDIRLLDGYNYEFVENTSTTPGSSHFNGIINPGLIKSIESFSPNAVLVFGWAFQSHLKVLRYFKGTIPVYFRGDSTLLDEVSGFSFKKLARRLFLTWVYSHIDIAFFVGTNNRKYYEVHGVAANNLVYAPHAIDNGRFYPKEERQRWSQEWKVSLNIAENKVVVLFAGKLAPKKNPMFLIEAAKQYKDVQFIIVGNGELQPQIDKAVAEIKNVTYLPFQNQSKMPVVYLLGDIFVLPSQGPGETWGLAINEAMASGRAVIASKKCGGAVDLIVDGENGFIIDPSVTSFVSAVDKLLKDKNRLRNYQFASLKRISNFTFDKIATAIEGELNKNN
jgi:glycosyltransferase involved in cell wall biosynthesis